MTIKENIEYIKIITENNDNLKKLLLQIYNDKLLKKYKIEACDLHLVMKNNKEELEYMINLENEIINSILMQDYINEKILKEL